VHEQARRIDLQIFAFHVEGLAVGTDAVAAPLAFSSDASPTSQKTVSQFAPSPLSFGFPSG